MVCFVNAQRINFNSPLTAGEGVEKFHILDMSAAKYTISNVDGSYVIPATVSNTLINSDVKHQTQKAVISPSLIDLGELQTPLIEKVNKLNKVVVGEILTGSLECDVINLEVKFNIDFYDLGILGNTGFPLTQSEQWLYDDDYEQLAYYYGLIIVVNLHKFFR